MYILGINAFHADSAACLLKDGKLIAAVEEERLRRVKHWAGFPSQAIKACLEHANIEIGDVDHLALNRNLRANIWPRLKWLARRPPTLAWMSDRLKRARKKLSVLEELSAAFPGGSIRAHVHPVEHHYSHMASAYYVSPFDEAVVLSVDGFGDFGSAAWGNGVENKLKIDGRIVFPDSLGMFYEAMTQYLGFHTWGDEYKVMGLAPYGRPAFVEPLKQILKSEKNGSYRLNLDFFQHHTNVFSEEYNGTPSSAQIFSPLVTELLGPPRQPGEELTQRHKDIARSVQAAYEDAFCELLAIAYQKSPSENLALAGGCAMNSVANGRLYKRTKFKRVYVQSAAGDAGGAIGAAYATWHDILGNVDRCEMKHAFWGPEYDSETLSALITSQALRLANENCRVTVVPNETDLLRTTAQAIADGKVVGWFQGRMEWGPRALGNRSILGDPRRDNMKDILNLKIKRRESFRPFAPSILREQVNDWFETDDDVPFMMQVFQIRAEKRTKIPAVCHVDGSGRLQTVTRDTNRRYYDLISEFYQLTKVPLVLNTSFNENEPVVCHPSEALNCFLRTKMDVLVLGDNIVERLAEQRKEANVL